jgi:hypothetical protein
MMSRLTSGVSRLLTAVPGGSHLLALARTWLPDQPPRDGPEGIRRLGHRQYVGGMWDEIGRLQFDFLVSEGLRPHHYLADVACGSLRAGVHLVPYLEPGHYLGIDKEPDLIEAGIRELGQAVYEEKRPDLVVSGDFEFERFHARPDYAIAQSLFTHLPAPMVATAFRKLRSSIARDGAFYATFFLSDRPVANPDAPHDYLPFRYTREQMERFGTDHGWTARYIGDWEHPRGQVMVRYRPT